MKLCERCELLYLAGYAEGQADNAPYSAYRQHWMEKSNNKLVEAKTLACTCKG